MNNYFELKNFHQMTNNNKSAPAKKLFEWKFDNSKSLFRVDQKIISLIHQFLYAKDKTKFSNELQYETEQTQCFWYVLNRL